MTTGTNAAFSNEFLYLRELVESGEVKFGFNKFFLRQSFSLWLIYLDRQPFILAYTALHLMATEWISIPLSIVLAWWFHIWWILILGVAFSWTVDGIIKNIAPDILRQTLIRDEKFLDHLWARKPFHMMIISTNKMKKPALAGLEKAPITIVPPRPWQSIVSEFGGG